MTYLSKITLFLHKNHSQKHLVKMFRKNRNLHLFKYNNFENPIQTAANYNNTYNRVVDQDLVAIVQKNVLLAYKRKSEISV